MGADKFARQKKQEIDNFVCRKEIGKKIEKDFRACLSSEIWRENYFYWEL
jgi:hypothetical protein